MSLKKAIFTLFIGLFLVWCMTSVSQAYILTLETSDGATPKTNFYQGDEIYLNIVLDDAAVAGCAFTLNYPSNVVVAPATDENGVPTVPGTITSLFPFTYNSDDTHRENSSEQGKIYFAGAEIDTDDGGTKYTGGEVVLFTVKFTVKNDAPLGAAQFELVQTELFNLGAGYGIDNNSNGVYDPLTDDKESVPVLVGALDDQDPDFNDLTLAFPILLDNATGPLATANFTVLDEDSDNDGMKDDWEIEHFGDIDTADETTDWDQDGYLDIDEEENYTDPKVQDEANAYPNYDPATDNRYLEGTRSHSNIYTPDETFDIAVQINYNGTLTALGLQETIPAGWTYVSVGGEDAPVTTPAAGAEGTLEFAWIAVPDSPVDFTYTVQVPAGEEGEKTFTGQILYRRDAGEIIKTIPDTTAVKKSFHSADYNPADWSINLSELLRIIQIYNVGSYHCDPAGEDGYGLGAGDQTGTPHDLDYNPQDWQFSLSELLRMIQIYNVGAYHVDPAGEDGYGLGPGD